MINAWSLAWEALNGTMDETYPKIKVDDKTGLWKEPQPYPYENDGLDYEIDTMADIDDQYSHYFQDNMDEDFYEPKRAHFYKYHEEEILKDIEEYVS